MADRTDNVTGASIPHSQPELRWLIVINIITATTTTAATCPTLGIVGGVMSFTAPLVRCKNQNVQQPSAEPRGCCFMEDPPA
ncbi:unnamed protein product [Caretta caretta]